MTDRLVKNRWRDAGAEMFLIVASVLVALTAQSLWNRHQDRIREAQYLTQIRNDLVRTSADLAGAIRTEQAYSDNIRKVQQVLHSSDNIVPFDSMKLWVVHKLITANVLRGTLDALTQTGDIQLIRDDSIRTAIIQYSATVARQDELSRGIDGSYYDRSSRARRAVERYGTFKSASSRDTAYSLASLDIPRMRADPEARGAFNDVWLSVSNTALHYRSLQLSTDSLIRLMDRRK